MVDLARDTFSGGCAIFLLEMFLAQPLLNCNAGIAGL